MSRTHCLDSLVRFVLVLAFALALPAPIATAGEADAIRLIIMADDLGIAEAVNRATFAGAIEMKSAPANINEFARCGKRRFALDHEGRDYDQKTGQSVHFAAKNLRYRSHTQDGKV